MSSNEWMISGFGICLLGVSLLVVFFGVEDLLLDGFFYAKRMGPKFISSQTTKEMELKKEKRIAIVIPAWHESQIIRKMLLGNLSQIKYQNFEIFVGCYPNDPETISEVNQANQRDSRVHLVVNSDFGPTSKGQMLNQIIEWIRVAEGKENFDAVLLQDSEDIIDPWALKLLNSELDESDFVQIPVFSLEVKMNEWVAGTYVDEFAESHTKDLLIRGALGAAIPSAGVGTALSLPLVSALIAKYGFVFYEKSLTEDYELGIRAHLLGFPSKFVSAYFVDPETFRKHFIATREYFPKKFHRSVRQKTRWMLGIAIQGWKNLGWEGSKWNRYFLYRDRRCLVSNLVSGMTYPMTLIGLMLELDPMTSLKLNELNLDIRWLLLANLLLMLNRLLQRMLGVVRVYGFSAVWGIPFRWPVATVINFFSSLSAIAKEVSSRWTHSQHVWSKTEHELPLNFGTELSEVA